MTEAQERVLKEIVSRQRKTVVGPTIREVAMALGCAANAVQQHVSKLRASGAVAPDAGNGIVLAEARPARKPLLKPKGKLA